MNHSLVMGIIILIGVCTVALLPALRKDKFHQVDTLVVSPKISPTHVVAPPPQETDIVRIFFTLINERRMSDAVGMINYTSESEKQAWGVQLNAMRAVQVREVVASMPELWRENTHTYKVTFDITMDPASATAPIPYYGYDTGTNIRWVTLEKVGTVWKIQSIATGP